MGSCLEFPEGMPLLTHFRLLTSSVLSQLVCGHLLQQQNTDSGEFQQDPSCFFYSLCFFFLFFSGKDHLQGSLGLLPNSSIDVTVHSLQRSLDWLVGETEL